MQIWGKHVPLFKLMYGWSRYTPNLGVGTCVSYACNGRCNDITPRLHRAFTTLVWPEFHFSFTLLLYFASHAEWDIYWRRWATKVAYTEALEHTGTHMEPRKVGKCWKWGPWHCLKVRPGVLMDLMDYQPGVLQNLWPPTSVSCAGRLKCTRSRHSKLPKANSFIVSSVRRKTRAKMQWVQGDFCVGFHLSRFDASWPSL